VKLFNTESFYSYPVFNPYYFLSFEGNANDQILALGSALLNK